MILTKKRVLGKFETLDIIEFFARMWLGYILITNSRIGVTVPLESLGMGPEMLGIFQSLWKTNFLMHSAKLVELLGGICLVLNFKVPLALLAIVPVVFNIYGLHIFLFGNPVGKGLAMFLICIFLVFRHREIFLPILKN